MKVTWERMEDCEVILNIEVEPEELAKATEESYHNLAKKVNIPGFRKGKAPRPMIERYIGNELLISEALEKLAPELYQQAIKEYEIEAITMPNIEITQLEPPIFKATVPVRPVVELGDYRSIRIPYPEAEEVTEDQINEAIVGLQEAHAVWEPVEREAHFGDAIVIDVTGIIGEETVLNDKGRWYELNEQSAAPVPGFAKQLDGMEIGSDLEFTLKIPDDFPDEELQEKDCLFKVSLSEVKERIIPEINDEFVKSIDGDEETVEQFRQKISDNLNELAKHNARTKLENEIIQEAVSSSKIEFPNFMTEEEVDRQIEEQMRRLGGIAVDDFLQTVGLTMDQFREQLRPLASERIRKTLAMAKICEDENIQVSDADIDAEVDRLSQGSEERREQLTHHILTAQNALESLTNGLRLNKALDILIEIVSGNGDNPVAIEGQEATSTDEPIDENTEEANDDPA